VLDNLLGKPVVEAWCESAQGTVTNNDGNNIKANVPQCSAEHDSLPFSMTVMNRSSVESVDQLLLFSPKLVQHLLQPRSFRKTITGTQRQA
jgi:hypothetical protein